MSALCILTHGVLNALSVFAPEPDYKNAVRYLSDPHRSRGCVCGISPAASAAVDKRGKLCQNGKKTPRGIKP